MIETTTDIRAMERDPLDLLWNFLSSVRMAIGLLSASAVAILIGTLVEQNQPLDKYLGTYGPALTHFMQALGIFDLYHTWWFELLMALICVNLILSNFNRAEKIVKKYCHVQVRVDEKHYEVCETDSGACSKSLQTNEEQVFSKKTRRYESAPVKTVVNAQGTLKEAALKLENAFLRLKYSFQKEETPNGLYYYADSGKLALWGSFIAHIGLLLLFIGVLYGHFPGQGFEQSTALLEGDSYQVPGSHFSFRLKRFDAKWDDERRPLLYRSLLDVTDENGKTFSASIEVNHPLTYRGVKIYQATYGPGKILGHYLDTHGKAHPFAAAYAENQMMFFPIDLGNGKPWVGILRHFVPDFAVGPHGEVGSLSREPVNPGCYFMVLTRTDKMPPDPKTIKPVGWLTRGRAASFKGVKFFLDRVSLFSGFQLRKDPGVPVIYLSFLVILLGVCLTFYLHHKVIRAKVSREKEGVHVVMVGVRRDKEQDYQKEFNLAAKILGG